MQMTAAQRTTLKNFLLADGTLSTLVGDANLLANALNANASPDFWVFLTAVTQRDCVSRTSVDGTNWSWSIFIARSQGERDAWREMFADTGSINPSRTNVQQAVGDIFSGAPGAAQRTHLQAITRRKATLAEKILATGTGSTASPGTLGVVDATNEVYADGFISVFDIGGILA